MPLVSSGGGVSQVKDTGHNGMESIGICLSVLTLSIFLVREIRTDKHPHHSPLPHTHTLQSQAQSHRTAPQPTNEIGPRQGERGTRAQDNTRALLPSGPAPTPLLRLLTPKNCRDWAGAGGRENAVRVRSPPPTHLASPALAHLYSKAPSAPRTRNSNADRPPPARWGPCGEGARRAWREPGTPTPSPAGGGGGGDGPLQEPRCPRSKGGWVR